MDLEEGQPNGKIGFGKARDALSNTLKERDDLSQALHDGASHCTNFSSSTGKSTNWIVNTKRLAKHHKYRALKNVELTNKLATITSKMEVKDQEMDKLRADVAVFKAMMAVEPVKPVYQDAWKMAMVMSERIPRLLMMVR